MPMEMKAEYLSIFAEESREELQEWEQALLALERNPADTERIHQMFRCVHTLKGSAGFIGHDALQKLAHQLESDLQRAREGEEAVDQPFIERLFKGLDAARKMVDAFIGSGRPPAAGGAKGRPGAAPTAPVPPAGESRVPEPDEPLPEAGEEQRYQVDVRIQGANREAYLRSLLVRKRIEAAGAILSCDPPPEKLRDSQEEFRYRLAVDFPDGLEALRRALNVDQVECRCSPAAAAAGAPAGAAQGAAEGIARTAVRPDEVVRVSVEKLDRLLNLVGELVVQNSGFISLCQQMKNGLGKSPQVLELESKTEALTKVSRDLQDGIMKVRMLPVSNVFSRFHRVVRDLARDRRKQVVLDIYGEETEIDKKVMDRIGEPLVHLIRNAIDHGIETAEARQAAGKDRVGRVRLGAYQEGDHICIEVADDGRGLDRQAILAKAIERGLFRREEATALGEQQILEAVFLPGFSTAKEVTDISGRGVGMDVVKRAAEEMGGGVTLRTSPGRGTTVTISLPLTMAIIPAVLLEAAGATLAIPLSSVREIVKLTGDNLHTIGGQGMLRLREEILSLVSLDGALALSGDMSGRSCQPGSPVVIVENDGRRIGLGVDRILHTSEIVIKSLSRHFREIEGLIGASILGNGKIALIVDVEALVRACCRGEKEPPVAGLEASPVHLASPADAEPAPAAQEEPPVPDSLRQRFEELLRRDRELFEEVHNSGAIQASMALSQLTGKEIRVSFPEFEIVRLGDLAGQLGGEDQVVGGIYTALQGELEGAILQVIPCEQLLRYAEVLYHYEEGTLKSIGENELSGLTEMGSIIAASFFNAFADSAGLAVQPTVPEISIDMCQAVIDAVLARFNQPGEEILLTRALIYYNDANRMACHLLIFLDQDSLASLLQAFSRQAGQPAAEQA